MNEEHKSTLLIWLTRRKRLLIGIATILLLISMIFFVDFASLIEKIVTIGILGLVIFIISYSLAFILRAYKLKLIFKGLDNQ